MLFRYFIKIITEPPPFVNTVNSGIHARTICNGTGILSGAADLLQSQDKFEGFMQKYDFKGNSPLF